MFERLGLAVTEHPRRVTAVWIAAAVAFVVPTRTNGQGTVELCGVAWEAEMEESK